MPRVLIPMADYGHDPTEVAVPYSIFKASNYDIDFVTESGRSAVCDRLMLEGIAGTLLGADKKAKAAYSDMLKSAAFQAPRSWNDPSFAMDTYDLVMLPGGHDKGVRQLIDSSTIHDHLAKFFPLTARSNEGSPKVIVAICHGVQVLAFTPSPNSPAQSPIDPRSAQISKTSGFKSIIHACATTALPGFMETSIYWATYMFLGHYYKTYGAATPTVQEYVMAGLDEPETQFKAGPGPLSLSTGGPFVVEDEKHHYISGRFPPDAEALAKRAVELGEEINRS